MYKRQEEDILAFAERNKHKITCINVSRHMQHYVVESNDSLLTRLPVPFRINCVLYKDYPKENLIPFIERFRKLPGANIQFRFDYTATTPENLYEPDKILHDLKEIAEYTGLDGCRIALLIINRTSYKMYSFLLKQIFFIKPILQEVIHLSLIHISNGA